MIDESRHYHCCQFDSSQVSLWTKNSPFEKVNFLYQIFMGSMHGRNDWAALSWNSFLFELYDIMVIYSEVFFVYFVFFLLFDCQAMKILHERGTKTVVITSSELGDNKTLIALGSSVNGEFWLFLFIRLQGKFFKPSVAS